MCHVLIIEDEALIALDLEMLLERHGATSFAFATAQTEAVAVARQRRPDIITSDVGLLEGTGPRAVEIIRIEHGPVPVIFITATPHLCTPGAQLTRIFLNRSIGFQSGRHFGRWHSSSSPSKTKVC